MGNQPPDQWGGQRSEAVEKYLIVGGGARTGDRQAALGVPDRAPRPLGLRRAGAADPGRSRHRRRDACRRWCSRPSRASCSCWTAATARRCCRCARSQAPQGAAAGDRTAPTQPVSALSFAPPPLAGRDMWGATPFDQLCVPHRLPPAALRGTLHAPFAAGHAGATRATSACSTGAAWRSIRCGRSAFTTPAYVAFTSKLVPRPERHRAGGARQAAGRRAAGAQRELRRALRGRAQALHLAAGHSVPAAAVGHRGRRRPHHRRDRLAAPQRHGARSVAAAVALRDGRAEHRRADRHRRRRRLPVGHAGQLRARLRRWRPAASSGASACRPAARRRR